jgi:hypothetical protein
MRNLVNFVICRCRKHRQLFTIGSVSGQSGANTCPRPGAPHDAFVFWPTAHQHLWWRCYLSISFGTPLAHASDDVGRPQPSSSAMAPTPFRTHKRRLELNDWTILSKSWQHYKGSASDYPKAPSTNKVGSAHLISNEASSAWVRSPWGYLAGPLARILNSAHSELVSTLSFSQREHIRCT